MTTSQQGMQPLRPPAHTTHVPPLYVVMTSL